MWAFWLNEDFAKGRGVLSVRQLLGKNGHFLAVLDVKILLPAVDGGSPMVHRRVLNVKVL